MRQSTKTKALMTRARGKFDAVCSISPRKDREVEVLECVVSRFFRQVGNGVLQFGDGAGLRLGESTGAFQFGGEGCDLGAEPVDLGVQLIPAHVFEEFDRAVRFLFGDHATVDIEELGKLPDHGRWALIIGGDDTTIGVSPVHVVNQGLTGFAQFVRRGPKR